MSDFDFAELMYICFSTIPEVYSNILKCLNYQNMIQKENTNMLLLLCGKDNNLYGSYDLVTVINENNYINVYDNEDTNQTPVFLNDKMFHTIYSSKKQKNSIYSTKLQTDYNIKISYILHDIFYLYVNIPKSIYKYIFEIYNFRHKFSDQIVSKHKFNKGSLYSNDEIISSIKKFKSIIHISEINHHNFIFYMLKDKFRLSTIDCINYIFLFYRI